MRYSTSFTFDSVDSGWSPKWRVMKVDLSVNILYLAHNWASAILVQENNSVHGIRVPNTTEMTKMIQHHLCAIHNSPFLVRTPVATHILQSVLRATGTAWSSPLKLNPALSWWRLWWGQQKKLYLGTFGTPDHDGDSPCQDGQQWWWGGEGSASFWDRLSTFHVHQVLSPRYGMNFIEW